MQVAKQLPEAVHRNIDKLKVAGFQLRLRHYPDAKGTITRCRGGKAQPYKGMSVMTALKAEGENVVLADGWSYCSLLDSFNRRKATHVAFDWLMHDLAQRLGRDTLKKILA